VLTMARALDRVRPATLVAEVTERPYRTIQTWARTGRIPHERRNGHLLVDIVAAAELSSQTPRRNRTHAAA
jgi:hypothetical protein